MFAWPSPCQTTSGGAITAISDRVRAIPGSAGVVPSGPRLTIGVHDLETEEKEGTGVVAIRLQRWSYLAGLVAVVLFVVGALLLFVGPNGSSPA
jgi:hypothetical protein